MLKLTWWDLHPANLSVVRVVTELHHAGKLQLQSDREKIIYILNWKIYFNGLNGLNGMDPDADSRMKINIFSWSPKTWQPVTPWKYCMLENGEYLSVFSLPENVKNFSIRMDPDEQVGHCDELKVSLFGVGEKHLGFPDCLNQFGIRQIQRFLTEMRWDENNFSNELLSRTFQASEASLGSVHFCIR